ncbi:MAG: SpoIID/LytB domain-containing protein [Lachnospiraceae bacterium]|nr:SpoIID/LytB domain-containing protein [Lachnospiraceae bacterium]
MFEDNQAGEQQDDRIKQKAFWCMLGIGLLIIVTILSFGEKPKGEQEKAENDIHIVPVSVETLKNVYITQATDTYISIFDGENKTFYYADGLEEITITGNTVSGNTTLYDTISGNTVSDNETTVSGNGMAVAGELQEGQLADIILTDGCVSSIHIRGEEKVSGKVVGVSETGVELENAGACTFAEDMKIYCLYGELRVGSVSDIRIGFSFADFILENGKVCGVLLTRDESMEYIRVQIMDDNFEGNYHDSVTLSCDTNYKLVYGTDMQIGLPAGESITIDKESPYFSQGNGANRIYIIPDALTGKISLHSVSRSQGTPAYRGTMELLCTENGLVVINEVLLEEYLYAVVPSEMPASYPLEALKAQAICARTYAYSHMLTPGLPEIGAHVNDSTGYQVYNNITEQPATTTAVKETAGQLLYVNEALASTYYYSTSCGFGSDEHVWHSEYGTELPHLTARAISAVTSPYTAESLCDEVVFTEFIQNRFDGDFEKEEPWYRWSYEATDLDAERLLKNLQGRYAANPSLVLMLSDGEYISCKPEKLGTIKNISVIKRNAGGTAAELLIEGSKATYKVITELYIRYVLCDGETKVCRQDGSVVDMNSLLPSGFFVLTPVKEDDKVTGYILTGGGFGHGAGMSQNGAKNMALSGYTATQILEFFFTNSEVQKVGENGT